MKDSTLTSCFYYPTTAIFLDDNKPFLDKMSLALADNLSYLAFTDPKKALAYIKEHNHAQQFSKKMLSAKLDSPDYGLDPQNCVTALDLSAICKQVRDPKRFCEATVLVIDYSMPDIDGLSFCKQLEGLPIKKILLTGEADETLAVDAFNAGLIDQFITKSSANFGEKVNRSIFELQREYFKTWSSLVLSNLLVQDDCALRRPAFVQKFHELCEKHNIVEYYVLDNSGSMLLIDQEGKPFWLIAVTASDLQDSYVVAKDHYAPDHVLEQIQSKQVLSYFLNGKDFIDAEGRVWEDHIFPATPIDAKKTGYYAFIDSMPFFGLAQKDILSFNQHLDGL